MPTYTYFVYTAEAFSLSGGRLSLASDFDATDDRRVVSITDNDSLLDGDYSSDERGYDTNQRATVYESDGTTLARIGSSTYSNARIYAEEQLILTGSDGSQIKVYVLESNGTVIGYLPTAPLSKGVTYSYSVTNVINDAELSRYDYYYGPDATDPGAYSDIHGATVICFTPNSQVTTPDGYCRLRDLQVGDLVLTRDRGFQPVRWIYRRRLSKAALTEAPHLAPIVFEPGSLGDQQPSRRMKVSPQHRMLIESQLSELLFANDAILVPAKGLVNGRTVYQDDTGAPVTYLHVMFDQHEVIEVDGLWSESYHPGSWVLNGAEEALKAELFELFPELSADPDAYGPSCYPAISVQEARVLAS
ncbi:Hint domain-containing protein [Arenibacterium sp. LLYu02]|uniref:Hint domain-containing protein n=1 Tax=Arenibacterium sp. LLYu02 TaxID=3404132 RepID=UPI003B2191EF